MLLYRREYIFITATEPIIDVAGDERFMTFDQTASSFAAEVLGSKTTSPNGFSNFTIGYSWIRSRLSAEEFQRNKVNTIFFNKEDIKKAVKKLDAKENEKKDSELRKAVRSIADPEYYIKLEKILKDGAEKRKIEEKERR